MKIIKFSTSTSLPRAGAAERDSTRPLISVFGSSQALPESRLYKAAFRMGYLLGANGFDVMTGGYAGVMEAASEGAHTAGAHVIGVTMSRFESAVNEHVMEEVHTQNFYERFGWLVDRADGYIAMHGGIGTLAEVAFVWQQLLLGIGPARPLILVGLRWRKLIASFRQSLIRTPRIFAQFALVDTPEDALRLMLKEAGPRRASERVRDQSEQRPD